MAVYSNIKHIRPYTQCNIEAMQKAKCFSTGYKGVSSYMLIAKNDFDQQKSIYSIQICSTAYTATGISVSIDTRSVFTNIYNFLSLRKIWSYSVTSFYGQVLLYLK